MAAAVVDKNDANSAKSTNEAKSQAAVAVSPAATVEVLTSTVDAHVLNSDMTANGASTGAIKVTDASQLDFETTPSFTLTVNANGSWTFDLDGQLDHLAPVVISAATGLAVFTQRAFGLPFAGGR